MNNPAAIILLKKISLWLLCFFLFIFPLFFLTTTTDAFVLPKQILLVTFASVLLFLWSLECLIEKKVILSSNPFNLPVGIFAVAILLSALLSRNMFDSLASAIPAIAAALVFFLIANTAQSKKDFMFVLGSMVLGGALSALISILYYFKLYILPIPAIQNQYFSTFGSPIQNVLYLSPLALMCVIMLVKDIKAKRLKNQYDSIFNAVIAIILTAGAALIIFQLISIPQKPVLLPYIYGFQIGTAAVSQDSGRLLLSFPFGSGYGTFLSDFTRFKLPEINLNAQGIWNFPFTYSSSFVLELLATTGIIGILSYFFLIAKVLKVRKTGGSPIFFGVIATFVVSFFLPFSTSSVLLLFELIGLYAAYLYVVNDRRVSEVTVSLVAFKRGLFAIEDAPEEIKKSRNDTYVLPGLICLVVLLVCGYLTYLSISLLIADTKIAASLAQSRQSKGQEVYDLQRNALITFPYRSDYYRIFSQINLALASSVAGNIPTGQAPTASTQQTISQLLQQSIGNARTSVSLAPITVVNWQNLSQMYRNLIGVGQNAEQFAIASQNQAILLDPTNPLLRIDLGGIYYQIKQYEAAQNQFKIAIDLKPDLANSYYNYGKALEAKGELANALSAYDATRQLIARAGNKADLKKLDQEIAALKARAGTAGEGQTLNPNTQGTENQPPLEVNSPQAPIPTISQQVKIPPPPGSSPTPTVKATPTP